MAEFVASLLFWVARGGGIVAAAVLLALATAKWCHKAVRILFCVGALLLLLLQGGCWYVVQGVGEGLGGGSMFPLKEIFIGSVVLALAYSAFLIFWWRKGD